MNCIHFPLSNRQFDSIASWHSGQYLSLSEWWVFRRRCGCGERRPREIFLYPVSFEITPRISFPQNRIWELGAQSHKHLIQDRRGFSLALCEDGYALHREYGDRIASGPALRLSSGARSQRQRGPLFPWNRWRVESHLRRFCIRGLVVLGKPILIHGLYRPGSIVVMKRSCPGDLLQMLTCKLQSLSRDGHYFISW